MKRLVWFGIASSLAMGAQALTWNGGNGGVWNATEQNWLDNSGAATAWQDGAAAVFTGSGIIDVEGRIRAASVSFQGNGTALLGTGTLFVDGSIDAADGTTNTISTLTVAGAGLTKAGAGALGVSRVKGPFTVAAGKLLVGGSNMEDANISVSSGASLEMLGASSAAGDLITNGSFELPGIQNTYIYITANSSGNDRMPGWGVVKPFVVHIQGSKITSDWGNARTNTPDGCQACILQQDGAITQVVTVAESALYDLSYFYCMRRANGVHRNFVWMDGVEVSAVDANNDDTTDWRQYSSGPIWLSAGSHTLKLSGEGNWADRSTFIDLVRVAPPSASAVCKAFGGMSSLSAVQGASIVKQYTGSVTVRQLSVDPATVSGSGTLAAGSGMKIATGNGGMWSSAALWQDGAAPSAGGAATLWMDFPNAGARTYANDLDGIFLANRFLFSGSAAQEAAEISGNALCLTNGNAVFSSYTPGTNLVSASLAAKSGTSTFNIEGTVVLSRSLEGNAGTIEKTGSGTLILQEGVTNVSLLTMIGGTTYLTYPADGAGLQFIISQDTPAALYLNLTSNVTYSGNYSFLGANTGTFGTTGTGHSFTFRNTLISCMSCLAFDIGAGDSVTLPRILRWAGNGGLFLPNCSIIKDGPGTLAFTTYGTVGDERYNEAGTFGGTLTLRDGSLLFGADDFGYNTGFTNPITGVSPASTACGSLGRFIANPVAIGDSSTPNGAVLKLIASNDGVCTERAINISSYGTSASLCASAGMVGFFGTTTIGRDRLYISGPTNATVVLGNLALASGTSSTTIDGRSGPHIVLDGSVSSGVNVMTDIGASIGYGRSATVSLGDLSLGGETTISFDASGHDTFVTEHLLLKELSISLRDDISGGVFHEPGTYTLFTYTLKAGVDNPFRVAAASQLSGYTYTFNDTGSAITLTIAATTDNPAYTWTNAGSGNWATGSNWDHGSAPDAADATALFGLKTTSAATVTLADAYTVGGLTFYNANAYTLVGGKILFNATAAPTITVMAGTHEIDSLVTNATSSPLEINITSQGKLKFGGTVASDLSVTNNGTLDLVSGAVVSGTATLAGGASVMVSGNATVDKIAAADGTANLAVNGTLTVGETGDSTYQGLLSGSGTLTKQGSSTLTLFMPATTYTFSGTTAVNQGTLALNATELTGTTSLGANGTLSGSSVHGLMGYYYLYPSASNTAYKAFLPDWRNFTNLLLRLTCKEKILFYEATGLSIDDTTTHSLPAQYQGGNNYWIGLWRGTIFLPESGMYKFRFTCDDACAIFLDGAKLFSHDGAGSSTYVYRYFTAGPHSLDMNLLEMSGDAYIKLYVSYPSHPGEQLVPMEWLSPDAGVDNLTGTGTLAPATGSSLFASQGNGFSTYFNGTLSGAAGSLFAKTGAGQLGLNYASGSVLAREGDLAVLASGADIPYAASAVNGLLSIPGQATVRHLYGFGAIRLGGYAFARRISGDSDCGISSTKTYTHLVDLSVGDSNYATVNGVLFKNTGSYTWINQPTGNMNPTIGTGIGSLVASFAYGSTDFTLTLRGLQANKFYEMRMYFRNFANNNRNCVFMFSVDGKPVDTVKWNPDLDAGGVNARSVVGCRYFTDGAGTLTLRVTSPAKDTCHFYGFSNELLGGVGGSDAFSLAPVAGDGAVFNGSLGGTAAVSMDGAGTQIFSGSNTLVTPLAVNAGKVVLAPGAAVTSGVMVASGGTLEMQVGDVVVNGVTGSGTLVFGATETNTWGALQPNGTFAALDCPRRVFITGDSDCGISAYKTYTHILDFGNNSVTNVNDVFFTKSSSVSGIDQQTDSAYSGVPGTAHGGGQATSIAMSSTNAIYKMFYDMNYSGNTNFLLSGLTAGTEYECRIYVRAWDLNATRNIWFSFDPDGSGTQKTIQFNEDGIKGEGYVSFRYKATSTAFPIAYKSLSRDTFHCYGLSNEQVPAQKLTIRADKDQTFAGTLAGMGEMRKTGVGTWTLAGTASTAAGAFSVDEGALLFTGGMTLTTGPVAVKPGAMAGGIGAIGGSVGVASNGTLRAGGGSVVGALAIGGNLALAENAKLSACYTSSAYSSVNVAGTAVIPTNTVVTILPLVAKQKPGSRSVVVSAKGGITGPADFSGWKVQYADGTAVQNVKLTYSADKKTVYLLHPTGFVVMLM